MPRATVGGLELEYRLDGPPSGEVIVLLMGSATPLVQWEASFVDALGAAGYRVVVLSTTVTPAGHRTSMPPSPIRCPR